MSVFTRCGSLGRQDSDTWDWMWNEDPSDNGPNELSNPPRDKAKADHAQEGGNTAVTFEAGDVLVKQGAAEGDEGGGTYFILSGQVETTVRRRDGHEALVEVNGPGSFCGELLPLGAVPKQPATYKARTRVKCSFLTSEEMRTLFERKGIGPMVPTGPHPRRPSIKSISEKLSCIESALEDDIGS